MTLLELSAQYRNEATVISHRLRDLRLQCRQTTDPHEAAQLRQRIHDLRPLLRQTKQLAELMEHYYDRGYKRHDFYTL